MKPKLRLFDLDRTLLHGDSNQRWRGVLPRERIAPRIGGATACEIDSAVRSSRRGRGTLNMREGKVQRLHHWLAAQGLVLGDVESTLYSDSINELPLPSAVDHAVGVDTDPKLADEASGRGWAMMFLH